MQFPDIKNATFMGDVHLGRRFIEGVPIDRRGEREEMVWQEFEQQLNACTTGAHIQVGDLFDGFDVGNEAVLRAAQIYIAASKRLPRCSFYLIRGNHDAARDVGKVSSFALFAELVSYRPNIGVVMEPLVTPEGFGLLPWDPFRSASSQAEALNFMTNRGQKLSFVVCHCDTKAWNGNDFNVLPFHQLKDITDIVVTGHEHIKRSFQSNGLSVHVTGSMQPYSHSEDPDHTMYWTGTAAELALIDPTNMYIRVKLQPNEDPPPVPNCLGFKTIAGEVEDDEAPDIEVSFESFDTTEIFKQILQEQGVVEQIRDLVLGRFKESMNG